MDSKSQIRAKFKKWLNESVKSEYSLVSGRMICDKIDELHFKDSQDLNNFNVSIFISKFPEISTAPLIDRLFQVNAQIYIPAWKSDEMWMCHVKCKKEFDQIIQSAPQNRIPMPQTEKVPLNVHIQH